MAAATKKDRTSAATFPLPHDTLLHHAQHMRRCGEGEAHTDDMRPSMAALTWSLHLVGSSVDARPLLLLVPQMMMLNHIHRFALPLPNLRILHEADAILGDGDLGVSSARDLNLAILDRWAYFF